MKIIATLLAIIALCVAHPMVMGRLAQHRRHRSRIKWTIVTLALNAIIFAGLFTRHMSTPFINRRQELEDAVTYFTTVVFFSLETLVISTVIVFIAIIVLPVQNDRGAIAQAGPGDTGSADTGEGDTKVCPRCAETVKAAAKICRFCGYSFEQPG